MKTMVFIRGWGSLDRTFDKLLKTKPVDWNVIIIAAEDLIYDFDLDKSIKRLHKIIVEKNISDFLLVGHSLGGAIAMGYSATYPENHPKLVLVNSVGIPHLEDIPTTIIKLFKQNLTKPATNLFIKIIEGIHVLKNPVFQYKLGKFSKKVNVLAHAAKITKPVLILHGDKDILVPLQNAQELKAAIGGAQLEQLKGDDHDWMAFHPEQFWKIVTRF